MVNLMSEWQTYSIKLGKQMKKIIIEKSIILQAKKPRFNPFQTGNGAHKNKKKYDRKRDKQIEDGLY